MNRPAGAFPWARRRVLVTGCAGFLGPWLAGILCAHGAQVVGLVRSKPAAGSPFDRMGLPGRVQVVCGQVEDYDVMEGLIGPSGVETVFHLAAVTPPLARRAPRVTFEANARGTWNVLEAVRVAGRPIRVIIPSTYEVYGADAGLPYVEDLVPDAVHPYGVSKAFSELLGRTYHRTYGVPVCAARMTSVYGGGDLNLNRLVPATIEAVLRDRPPVIRSDGRMVRDFLYVGDAVQALLGVAEAMDGPEQAGEAFNFASEEPVSVLELVTTILRLMGRSDLAPQILDRASGEIPAMYSSSRKARARLGWSAQVSLEAGLQKTIAWYREYWQSQPAGRVASG